MAGGRVSGLPSVPDIGFDCYLIQVIKKLVNPLFAAISLNFAVVSGVVVHVGLNEHLICCAQSSEEVGLTHDAHELLFRDFAISIAVCFFDHFCDLIIGHILAKLFGNSLEISEGDFACLIIIEETECFEHFFAWVSLSHLLSHHVEELWIVNDTGAVLVNISDHLLDFLAFWLEAKGTHCYFKFFLVDVARAISVEQVEGFFDLLLLFFGDVSSLLGALESLLLERCLQKGK